MELLGIPTTADGDNVNAGRVVLGVAIDGTIAVILEDPDPKTVVEEVLAALAPQGAAPAAAASASA